MSETKRMVDTYEIDHAIHVGDKEILFGVDDTKTDCTYMVCDCTWDNPLGIDCYDKAVGSADYLEMMTEFATRVSAQIEAVKAERERNSIPMQPFAPEHCTPNDYRENIENKVVVIRSARLRPEYRTADRQLVLVMGVFGASANSRGRAVFTVNLYSGKEARWNREDILGVLKPEYMPDWAKERLNQVRAPQRAAANKHQPER
ncbi:MAG: hypothetical protein ACYCX2_03760 [Christensenellales bacterium]